MTPRPLDWRSVHPKLREIEDLVVDHYRRYAQQVARWFQELDAE